MRCLMVLLLSASAGGCVVLSVGQVPPEQLDYLRDQGQCKQVARAARSKADGDARVYEAAYEECMSKRGYR